MAIATINPTTGETVETFEPHDDAEVARRIAEAAAAADTLRDTTFAQRAQWMNATADILEADVERVARMLTLEMGKPLGQARGEVLKCAKNMRFYAEHAESFLADEPLADASTVSASQAWTVWQPLGVVLAVMPWKKLLLTTSKCCACLAKDVLAKSSLCATSPRQICTRSRRSLNDMCWHIKNYNIH